MASITDVIAWIFVAAFAITLTLALLDLADIIRINDPSRRKWLFSTLLVSVVVPVATFGAKIFEKTPVVKTPNPIAAEPANTTVDEATNESATAIQLRTSIADTKPESKSTVDTPAVSWLTANMPTRPTLSANFSSKYPDCIPNLRSATSPSALAADCRSALEHHKAQFVLSYYGSKIAYDAAIKSRQTELSRRGLTTEEAQIYNFLQSENEDLNYREGASFKAIVEAETRINRDIEYCREQQ